MSPKNEQYTIPGSIDNPQSEVDAAFMEMIDNYGPRSVERPRGDTEFEKIVGALDLGEDIGQARAEITDSPVVQESGILKATSNVLKGLIGW